MKCFGRQNEIKELAQERLSMDRRPLLTKYLNIRYMKNGMLR